MFVRITYVASLVAASALLAATGWAASYAEQDADPALSAYQVEPAPPSARDEASGGVIDGTSPRVLLNPIPPSTPSAHGASTGRTQSGNAALAARAGAAVDPVWAARTADLAGIPLPALTAYARGSMLAPRGCRIGWTTLAGIGWIESQHGTIGERALGPDGHSSTPILGPALDGTGEFAAIAATPESALWHGDDEWDHAVGPMQFIPSTWRTWQVDGDGDGTADPNDLDDAALAAARYLCQSGDLLAGDNWSRSIFSYNHSLDYVLNVYTAADSYADLTE